MVATKTKLTNIKVEFEPAMGLGSSKQRSRGRTSRAERSHMCGGEKREGVDIGGIDVEGRRSLRRERGDTKGKEKSLCMLLHEAFLEF